ncbi:hypothetical protein ETN89_15080 [Photobacterium damselae subsp. damselae]|uniref:hypothetical protein n=1 Tax=Photobacterium damselae TaxID=38293 RepID=UPI000A2FEF77|nr:hypothetical protein [Photobacterium damselae]ARR51578.1 hypothetical protein CAY62_19500 [Photobacterium damselae subsp. damselae]QAY36643.1 hypothetical protein ETN89_15080 [Photobacterium damselae subsp. damselae]QOQ70779.1 hypothetical protein IL982_15560 [Photobacterium damselae subsp. damselae]
MKQNIKLTILMYSSFSVTFIWFAIGAIIIGSSYIDANLLSINVILGSFFQLVSLLFLVKEYHFYRFMTDSANQFSFDDRKVKRVMNWEFCLIYCIGLIGLITLYGVYFRVFSEGFPVFG